VGWGTKGVAHGIVNESSNISDCISLITRCCSAEYDTRVDYADDRGILRILHLKGAFEQAIPSDPTRASDGRRRIIFDMPASDGEVNPG